MKEKELVPGKYNVIITSYEISVKEKAALKKFNWRYLIIDEAHRIKNEQSSMHFIIHDICEVVDVVC
jgi:SWI/SNF-related matrix-associated actin-dependent regulator of chromatin subfamily A member 5